MPWYKIDVRHGAGHQSHSEKYVWSDEKPTRAEREEWFEDFVHERYMHDAIGDVRKVAKLPEKVRLEKILTFEGNLRWAQRMLEILGPKTKR